MVAELERRLRVSEPVIKFITVRMDEEEKRLAKVKALRGTRRKVSTEGPASAGRRGSQRARPGQRLRTAQGLGTRTTRGLTQSWSFERSLRPKAGQFQQCFGWKRKLTAES